MWASLVVQMVKHLSVMQEIQVQFLGWENPLEKEMAAHSSTFAGKIPSIGEAGSLQSWVAKQSDTAEQLNNSNSKHH